MGQVSQLQFDRNFPIIYYSSNNPLPTFIGATLDNYLVILDFKVLTTINLRPSNTRDHIHPLQAVLDA